MTKLTLACAVLIIALGLAAFLGSGRSNSMVLVPMFLGVALGVLVFLGIRRENKRMLYMEFNAVLGTVGVIWSVSEAIRGYGVTRAAGVTPDYLALAAEMAMIVLFFIYVNLYVRTVIARQAVEQWPSSMGTP
jgi:hypothetical protein